MQILRIHLLNASLTIYITQFFFFKKLVFNSGFLCQLCFLDHPDFIVQKRKIEQFLKNLNYGHDYQLRSYLKYYSVLNHIENL